MPASTILFVYNQDPYTQDFGGNLRLRHLMMAANEDGFQTDLLTIKSSPAHPSEKKPLNRLMDSIIQKYRESTSKLSSLEIAHKDQIKVLSKQLELKLRNTDFDYIQVEHSYLGEVLRNQNTKAIKIIDFHNVHSYMDYPEGESIKIKAHETNLRELCDLTLVCSQQEADRLLELGYQQVKIVPNGVAIKKIIANRALLKNPTLLYVGNLKYKPNLVAIKHFIEQVMPLVHVKFQLKVVGDYSDKDIGFAKGHPNIKFHGYQENLDQYFQDSVFICPVNTGGGTRIKILTAMAYGVPVISYPKGAEGIDHTNGENILLAETEVEFASIIDQVINNPGKYTKIGMKGRHLVETKYSWSKIGNDYTYQLRRASLNQITQRRLNKERDHNTGSEIL